MWVFGWAAAFAFLRRIVLLPLHGARPGPAPGRLSMYIYMYTIRNLSSLYVYPSFSLGAGLPYRRRRHRVLLLHKVRRGSSNRIRQGTKQVNAQANRQHVIPIGSIFLSFWGDVHKTKFLMRCHIIHVRRMYIYTCARTWAQNLARYSVLRCHRMWWNIRLQASERGKGIQRHNVYTIYLPYHV